VLGQALEVRKGAAGRDRADLADTMNELARVYHSRGELDRADLIDQEVLRLRREVFGPEHIKVAHAINNLGIGAFYRERYDQAEQYFRQAAAMARRVGNDTDAAQMQNGIGTALSRQGRLQEGVDEMRESTKAFVRALGPDHTRTQIAKNNLANSLTRLGQYEEAEQLQRETLRVGRKLLGPEHFMVAMALYNLGSTLEGQGRFDEAERVLEESLSIYAKARREPHSETAWTLAGLASVQLNLRKYDLAERTYRAAIETFNKVPNTWPPNAAFAWDGLGEVFHARGRIAEAEMAFRRAHAIRQEAGEKGHGLAESQAMLAKIECERGSPEVGERLAQQSVDSRRSAKEPHPIGIAFAESILGRCRAARGRFDEAEVLLTKAYETLARRGPTNASRYAAASLVVLYESWKKPEKAAVWRSRAR
jgi:tetratricopeptide (TPR) repeat protein